MKKHTIATDSKTALVTGAAHGIGRTGRAKKHGVAYTFVATITEGIRMDDIVRNTRAEVQRLKYDKDGCLMLVEENGR